MELLVALGLGYVIGLLQKGITINHKGEEVPQDKKGNPIYNKGVPSNDEVREYVEKNNGIKNW